MRFRIKEFRSFVASIEAAAMQQSDFDFVKKRGWLSIVHRESKNVFRYHRKKETTLDEKAKWKDSFVFLIQIEKEKKQLLENESDVLSEFETWLDEIAK